MRRAILIAAVLAVPLGAQEPTKKPDYQASFQIDGGPVILGTPAETKSFIVGAASVTATLWRDWDFGVIGSIERDPNGDAIYVNDFNSVPTLSAYGWAKYRVAQSIFKVGVVGGVAWGYKESQGTPQLWTIEVAGCVEKFLWWTEGGEGCIGIGKRDLVGGNAVSAYFTQPITGPVWLRVQMDVPFEKLPEVVVKFRELAPLAGPIPPTPQQIIEATHTLPIRVEAGLLVRGIRIPFWAKK